MTLCHPLEVKKAQYLLYNNYKDYRKVIKIINTKLSITYCTNKTSFGANFVNVKKCKKM